MPCRTDFEYDTPRMSTSEQIVRDELNKVTKVACNLYKALRIIVDENCGINPDDEEEIKTELRHAFKEKELDEIFDWYRAHKVYDTKRKAELKESALKKLTNEEKEALGLD